jgi:5-formyltetrahydrofolate cyclo-ligase
MCYGFQMFDALEPDPHDIPVNYVLSQEVIG